jgi:putative intracellular protease/amidase
VSFVHSTEVLQLDTSREFSLSQTEDVEILFLMDHDYGANYHYIRPIMEGWGWNVTVAGPSATLTPCDYQSDDDLLNTDLIISSISDLSSWDAISIMPGASHANLLDNAFVHNLLQTALADDLIVSAWCRAVRIFARAGILNGRNCTGNSDYADEYEAAGATYLGVVPPVIDGNVVTGVRSRFYRLEMCQAIATALGVFETDPPAVANPVVDSPSVIVGATVNLTIEVTDVSPIESVTARVFQLNGSTDERLSSVPTITVEMNLTLDDVYNGSFSGLQTGRYTVDIRARDVFDNVETYENVVAITVEDLPPDVPNLDPTLIALVGGSGVAIIAIVVILSRRGSSRG